MTRSKKVLLSGLAMGVWFGGTLFLSFAYMILSVVVNGGHPWPYNPYLFWGGVPVTAAVATGVAVYWTFRSIIRSGNSSGKWPERTGK